jgi:hypothetical protein
VGSPGDAITQSQAFRPKWAAHNVRFHDTGVKRLHHPLVGDLELTYEAMELAADGGLTIFAYTAEPGSRSQEGLNLLASWNATPEERRRLSQAESLLSDDDGAHPRRQRRLGGVAALVDVALVCDVGLNLRHRSNTL